MWRGRRKRSSKSSRIIPTATWRRERRSDWRPSNNTTHLFVSGCSGFSSKMKQRGQRSIAGELKLRISEIFYSLQGETSRVGLPTVFVRLTGCPLRCTYCDTSYAFTGGQNMDIAQILEEVAWHRARYVTVTGGEPLAQKNCLFLLQSLCDAGYEVSLETGGALDVSKVDARVVRVLDIKTPASGEMEKNMWGNLAHLNPRDEIKFV